MKNIVLGRSPGGRPVEIDLKVLLRTRALVQANSGGGKSYLLRRLAEQLFGKVQTIILDREGEFSTLRQKYGYLHVGDGGDTPADVRSAKLLAEKILEHRISAVCDLFEAFRSKPLDRRAWVAAFLEALIDAPRSMWRDLVVIVDEAHQFCPQENPKAASMAEREIVSRCKEAMIALATVGRKRGYCAIWATQRLAKLDKDATAELFNRLVGMTIEDVDVDRATDLMSVPASDKAAFKASLRNLEPGNFYGFGRAIASVRTLVKVGSVTTEHPEPGAQQTHGGPPPAPESIRHLLPKLADLPKEAETKAKTEAELRAEIRKLRLELSKKPEAKPSIVEKLVEVKVLDRSAIAKAVSVVAEMRKKIGGIAGAIDQATADGLKQVEAMAKAPAGQIKANLQAPVVSEMVVVKKAPSPIVVSEDVERNGFSNPQLQILRGLREFNSIGLDVVTRAQLAGWLGKKVSGTFKNDISRVCVEGCVTRQGEGLVLTNQGLRHAPETELSPNAQGIYEKMKGAVSGPQQDILRVLWEAGEGVWMTRSAVAEALGKQVSGTFKNDVSHLHASQMIEYQGARKEEKQIRLSMWVFCG